MTPAEKLALQAAMPVLEAEEELKAGVSDERLYDVALRATGSEREASAALAARVEYRLRRNETPGV